MNHLLDVHAGGSAEPTSDNLQAIYPHIFVNKLPDRHGAHVCLGTRSKPSRNLTVDEVTSAYAAAEFAAEFGLFLDTHVTLDFGRLGVADAESVQAALSQFTRCFAAWCAPRHIPVAWIAVIEMGRDGSYHAHIALHVPGDLANLPMGLRTEFRSWARGYTERRGGWIPRAIKVRCGLKESILAHWIAFHYLVKGYDRAAVLCSERNSLDGRAIRLGDIIARYYRDPGPVALNRRISISNSLGPKRREFGAPTGRDFMLPHGPNWAAINLYRTEPLALHEELTTRWQVANPTPFRSKLEDGIYDVRRLYSPCFYEFVTKLPVVGSANAAADNETPPSITATMSEQLARFLDESGE